MNRDWFAMTQPEVRGRVRAFLDYYPLVHVDLHEMGTDSSYYFPPPAVPWNPHLTGPQRAMLETFGRGNAAAFDRAGYRYFTGEVYDAYYPGYGDTWPALQGSAGMTFEMASARGLLGQRSDGSLVSYRDGVRRHVTASLATIATAAGQRARLLGEFLAYRRGPDDGAVFFLPRRRDPGRVDALAGLLRDQGIEVRRLAAPGPLLRRGRCRRAATRWRRHSRRAGSPPPCWPPTAPPTPTSGRSRSGAPRSGCRWRSTTWWAGRCRSFTTSRC